MVSSKSHMGNIKDMIELAEQLIASKTGNTLNPIQKVILGETLCEPKKTYAEIAQKTDYSESYIKQWIAPKLWQELSAVFGEKVNKFNCRLLLEKQLNSLSCVQRFKLIPTQQSITLESPEGQIPLFSPFYIERSPSLNSAFGSSSLEQTCYQAILQPGALICIKGPRKMGKTSLIAKIMAYGTAQNYHAVRLSLYSAGVKILGSVEKFFRWLCANVTWQLRLESKLDDYWNEDMGALANSTIYFQSYILQQISSPIILALDEVNQLFEYPDIIQDFFSLLRVWHEETKNSSVWQKLRLIIAYSNEVYIPFSINQSPFNVGLVIELSPFTQVQVEDLAQRHGLQLTSCELEQLMKSTGGFPYLVRLTLYHSVQENTPIVNLLQDGATDTGIFSKHLHCLLWSLQQKPNLADGFRQVLKAPCQLYTELAFKLKSLGLVHLERNEARVSCELYRQYFSDRLQ